jgi:hypothetical protein
MDHASFHVLRTAVQENARPADEGHAQFLQRRLSEALVASRLFDQVELGRTEDPDQLVIGLCRCAEGILPWEAGIGVERVWSSIAAEVPWESHTLACTDSLMEFEGAVTIDSSGHFITVRLLAEPPAVRQASARYGDDRNDAPLAAPVPLRAVERR